MSQEICLKRNIHRTMIDEFQKYLFSQTMVDVTLACDGNSLKAHKLILSSCSPFFESLFLENPCKHPIVILKDVKYTELKAVIDFVYQGEVNVTKDRLEDFLKTAETLSIKVLVDNVSDVESVKQSSSAIENMADDAIEVIENKSGDANKNNAGNVRVLQHQSGIRSPDQPTSKTAISSPKRKRMKMSELHKDDAGSEPINEQDLYLSSENLDISDMDSPLTLSALKELLKSKKQSIAVSDNLANNNNEKQNIETFENNRVDVPKTYQGNASKSTDGDASLHQPTSKTNTSTNRLKVKVNESHNVNTISEPIFYLSAIKVEHCDTEVSPLTLSASAVTSEPIPERIHDKDIANKETLEESTANITEQTITTKNLLSQPIQLTQFLNMLQQRQESADSSISMPLADSVVTLSDVISLPDDDRLKSQPVIASSSSPAPTPVLSQTSNSDNNRLATILECLQSSVTDLKEQMQNIEFKLLQNQRTDTLHEEPVYNEISFIGKLPLTSLEQFDENEINLKDQKYFNLLVNVLISLGGRDCRTFIYNMLKRLMTSNLGNNFSFTGRQAKDKEKEKKRSFCTTLMYTCLKVAVKKVYPETKEDSTKLSISLWLQQAKHRMIRRGSKENLAECSRAEL